MIGRSRKSQLRNIEKERCRYGAAHPKPRKGRKECDRCTARRIEDRKGGAAKRLCRVDVLAESGIRYVGELYEDGAVRLRVHDDDGKWAHLADGTFQEGEILGVLGGSVAVDLRVYAAIENAFEGFTTA